MTESDIVRAIRARSTVTHEPTLGGGVDHEEILRGAGFGQMFIDMNGGPTGIRRGHVLDALHNIWAWDAHEREGIVTYIVLSRVRWPAEHTLLMLLGSYRGRPPQVEWAWRLYGSVPQDPTQALAHLIARYGLVVEAGDERAIFHPAITLPDGAKLTVEGTQRSTISTFVRKIGDRTEYSWVFALSDFDYMRDEARARQVAPRVAAEGPQYEPPVERLPDSAVIVRGGVMLVSDLKRACEVNQQSHGYAGISVWADESA